MKRSLQGVAFAIGIVGLTQPLGAKVIKFEILRTESPAFEGRTFGAIGTYDRIIARATIAVAPDDPHNSVIVDIDRAPRNAQALVEAVSDVEILRPTVAANGNRRLFYEVVNRGNKLGLALFNGTGVINDPLKAADAGNGFLMSRGYTVVWSGWQGDAAPGGGRLTFSPPIVPAGDRSRSRGIHLRPFGKSRARDPELSRRRSRSRARQADSARTRGRLAKLRRATFRSSLTGQTGLPSADRPALMPARSTNSSTSPKTQR